MLLRAVEGCWAVLHTASPFPNIAETDPTEESLVKPAVEGTTRVLKAAAAAGVKKVVLTSSFAAVHGAQSTILSAGLRLFLLGEFGRMNELYRE